MEEYIQIHTTLERKEDARRIARHLVQKRLVACAQILGPISSSYWWKGDLQEEEEWLCVMKSKRDLYPQIEGEIKALHPYEEPEILATPVLEGSKGYLAWLEEQVKSS